MLVSQQAGELEHMVLHGKETNHHHHADEVLHMDDDGAPVQHIHADSGAGSAVLLNASPPASADFLSTPPPEMYPAMWLSPTLEGPLRPPM